MAEREYDCIECGRHVISFGYGTAADHGLCACCLMNPGWFKIPSVRAVVDPTHDGLDAIERQQMREAQ